MPYYTRSAAAKDRDGDFRRRDFVYFKQQGRGYKTRLGYISSKAQNGETPYTLRVCRGSISEQKKVSSAELTRADPTSPQFVEERKVLEKEIALIDLKKRTKKKGSGAANLALSPTKKLSVFLMPKEGGGESDKVDVPYLPLREALKGERLARKTKKSHLRIATFNVCHLGGCASTPGSSGGRTTRSSSRRLPREKVLNLAATVRGSLADVVVLQEVNTGAHEAVSSVAAEIGPGWRVELTAATSTSGHGAKECYALIYNEARVEEVLGGAGAVAGTVDKTVRAKSFMYDRGNTGDAAFRNDAGWGNEPRVDFTFDGASGARLPGYFRLHHAGSKRSIILATVHTAYDNSTVRALQFSSVKSLLPQLPVDSGRVLFALLGDFNSDANNTLGMSSSVSFSDTAQGKKLEQNLKECSFVNVSNPSDATSIGGFHYDEIFVQEATRGRRDAHVFPTKSRFVALANYAGGGLKGNATALQLDPVEVFTPVDLRVEASKQKLPNFTSKVFTDHFLVFVDVEFTETRPFSRMTVVQLRAELKKRKKKVSGLKAELIARLGGGA
ncbi:hypothetical protein TrLO_g8279 [Triparma laevis f. longispina]|uniref:SAP domain-containing protein n=1 Tax=Triparma laevis f. longispina TaxID=1714387 RepID=A0A9W7CJZ0_9STRA|nr:hypothetical protein TrLO_g8279 [Triparma laevis f. longispina]